MSESGDPLEDLLRRNLAITVEQVARALVAQNPALYRDRPEPPAEPNLNGGPTREERLSILLLRRRLGCRLFRRDEAPPPRTGGCIRAGTDRALGRTRSRTSCREGSGER